MSWPLGFPEPRLVEAGDVTFSVHEAGPRDGLPLLMLHGWPELALSWAPMVPRLTEAGCRLIMPDLKGFGGSSKPTELSAYSMASLTRDYSLLLDALGFDKVVMVGHDWGGAIIWPLAQRYADRGLAVASLCTPHPPLAPAPPLSIMRRKQGERFYIVQFQDPDLPDRTFGGSEETFFSFLFRPGPPREQWGNLLPEALDLPGQFAQAQPPFENVLVPPEALNVYARLYQASGHHSPTMLYRAIDQHWEERRAFDPPIDLPALMVTAERDMALPKEASAGMEERCSRLSRGHVDCGHWITWEAPEAASGALINWLTAENLLPALK